VYGKILLWNIIGFLILKTMMEHFYSLCKLLQIFREKDYRRIKLKNNAGDAVVDTESDIKLKLKVKIIHLKKQDVSH
jgi:hypothetical protein